MDMRGSGDGADIGRIWSKCCFASCGRGSDISTSRIVFCFLGGGMKRIIIEYAGAVIAIMGTLGFFAVLGSLFLDNDGGFGRFILIVLGGL